MTSIRARQLFIATIIDYGVCFMLFPIMFSGLRAAPMPQRAFAYALARAMPLHAFAPECAGAE